MPKIFLSGETQPVIVSQADAERILDEKNDPKHKGMIRVGIHTVNKGRIREIAFTNESGSKRYNLDVQADKKVIIEFESFCRELQAAALSERPLAHYGSPLNQETFPGYVLNELLGGVHWSLVEWALKESIIARREKPYLSWAIVNRGSVQIVDMSPYDDLRAKLDALSNLEGRRKYAKRKDLEAQAAMVDEGIESLKESTAMPKP